MKPYTKHKIIRIKNLDRPSENIDRENLSTVSFYELLFQTDGTLNFAPGSQVKIYNTQTWCYVASEPQAPWTRLIIDNSKLSSSSWAGNIKIGETKCLYEDLIEDKNPAFYVTGEGIAIPLSYISTFPDRKPTIVYPAGHISLDFLKARSDLQSEIELHKRYYTNTGEQKYGHQILKGNTI